jgi:hypothetical protein
MLAWSQRYQTGSWAADCDEEYIYYLSKCSHDRSLMLLRETVCSCETPVSLRVLSSCCCRCHRSCFCRVYQYYNQYKVDGNYLFLFCGYLSRWNHYKYHSDLCSPYFLVLCTVFCVAWFDCTVFLFVCPYLICCCITCAVHKVLQSFSGILWTSTQSARAQINNNTAATAGGGNDAHGAFLEGRERRRRRRELLFLNCLRRKPTFDLTTETNPMS